MDVLSKNLERILGKHNTKNSLPMFFLKDLIWYYFIVYVTYCIGSCIFGKTLSKPPPPPPPPFIKGGWDFPTMALMRGGGGGVKSLLEMGEGEPGMRVEGGVLVMGGMGNF